MTIDRGHKGSIVAIILLILTLLISAHAVASGETGKTVKTKGWPMFGHDPQHTGRSPVTGISKRPVIKWASSGDHFVVDEKGKIYVGFSESRYEKRRLVALSDDGKILWTYHSKKEFTSPPALGANGSVLVGAGKYLVAVSRKGAKQWESKVLTGDYNEINSPLVVSKEGTIYLTTSEKKLVALDSTGKKKWTFERRVQEDTFPAVGPGGTIYITSDKDNLLAIGQKGSLKWKFATEKYRSTPPSVGVQDGNTIIYFGAGSNLYAVSSKGTKKWVYKTGGKLRSPPAIGPDGTVFFGSSDAHYYAVNPDGTTDWIVNARGEAVGEISPVVDSEGVAYLSISTEVGGYISAVSPDGAVTWKVLMPEICVSLAIGPKGSIYGVYRIAVYALGSCSPSTRRE